MTHVMYHASVQIWLLYSARKFCTDKRVDISRAFWLIFWMENDQYMSVWMSTLLEFNGLRPPNHAAENLAFHYVIEETAQFLLEYAIDEIHAIRSLFVPT